MPQEAPSAAAHFAVFDSDLSDEWLNHYGNAKALAVDTEAMGLIHGRDRLCLVQIADEQDRVCCIRIARGQSEAPRLQQLMEAESIEKVFHYARFDVAALATGLGIQVNPIFCTKVASRLARTYSPRHGLKEVVNDRNRLADWFARYMTTPKYPDIETAVPEHREMHYQDRRYVNGFEDNAD